MSGGSSRVPIPSGVRTMIQNIQEIARNHSDEEIYAMLKECAMDPNETAQKLLLQDTFHEVKKKRDKRKENNREPADSRWKPGVQGRGGRGGRGTYSSRYFVNDAGGGRNVSAGKENGVNQSTEKGNAASSSTNTPDTENKSSISRLSSVAALANGPTKVDHPIPLQGSTSQESSVSGITSTEENSPTETDKMGTAQSIPVDVKSGPESGQSVLISDQLPSMISGVCASAADPVLVPSFDARIPGAVGTIRREVGSQRTVVEATVSKGASCDEAGSEWSSVSVKGSSEVATPDLHGKMLSKYQEFGTSQLSDTSHTVSSSLTGSTGSRPSSNYSSRSQQLSGSQKVGPSKEWKPKSTQVNPAQPSGTLDTSDTEPSTVEALARSLPASSSMGSEDTTMKLEKKLEELRFPDTEHVIIPHHLQVPESERHGLSFGSFDSSFKLIMHFENGPACNKSSMPPSESSQEIEENIEVPSSSIHNASPPTQEVDYPHQRQSPTQMPENMSSGNGEISSGITGVPEYDQPKPEAALAPEGPQYSVVHTAPTYSTFGLVPPMLGSQFAPSESTEPQARDATRLPSFVVQQPFDPSTSYYTQIYRPNADGDGRFSPFLATGAATKYNGNVAVLPSQSGQSAQETGNSLVLSSAGPTSLSTQTAGVMQSSIPVTQQPVPVFRQPAGVHISHYPPNYLPYSQYFSPFYVPPPALHHFMSNTGFPQQPPTGSIYPPPAAAAAATSVKYSISQYKPGTNTGNSNHIGIPTGYGTYTSTPAGYSPSPAVTSGNSTGNEDLPASQYKENSGYIAGQQSEGSAVWIPAPGREISGLQPNSFYNLPPQGQHIAFAPTQAGHGAFAGIFHPTQTVAAAAVHPLLQQSQAMAGAVEIGGPPAGVYQQPHRAQINWANNY